MQGRTWAHALPPQAELGRRVDRNAVPLVEIAQVEKCCELATRGRLPQVNRKETLYIELQCELCLGRVRLLGEPVFGIFELLRRSISGGNLEAVEIKVESEILQA